MTIVTADRSNFTSGGGAIAASAAIVQRAAIESAAVTDLPVTIAGFLDALGQAIGTESLGIIGFNYLREFRVTIDYPGGFLLL